MTYMSLTIENATSVDSVVEAINEGVREGIEGIEFNSEMLAGCYAFDAARDAGCGYDEETIDFHLGFIGDAGAQFDNSEARKYALELAETAEAE